ncbi:MAG: hypothetical protein ACON4X_01105 [Polaribacter sp.]
MKYKIQFYSSLIIFIGVLYLFLTGSSWLTLSLHDTKYVPAGTFITWLGMIAFPTSIYFGVFIRVHNGFRNILKKILIGCLIMAILWIPVCYLLAGNISFSFSGKPEFQGGQTAMKLFWIFTYGIPAITLVTLILDLMYQLTVYLKSTIKQKE